MIFLEMSLNFVFLLVRDRNRTSANKPTTAPVVSHNLLRIVQFMWYMYVAMTVAK